MFSFTVSPGMETVRTYLESGSINGLNHIAATKKWERLFWILIVILGFKISILLILEMFINWGDNPIRTDVDTLPMSEIRFPKVTVCPPKDTFTDLNYDIKHAGEKNLTLKEREALSEYAKNTIESISFMESLNRIQEKDRFYNWYYAISQMELLVAGSRVNILSKYQSMNYEKETMATSGFITSQFFGQKFDKNLFFEREGGKMIEIRVIPPKMVNRNQQNLTLHLNIEYVSLPSRNYYTFIGVFGGLKYYQNTAYFNITITTESYWRDIQKLWLLQYVDRDIGDLEMDLMPGFNFSWWYTGGDVEPGNIYKKSDQMPDDFALALKELKGLEDDSALLKDDVWETYQEFVRNVVLSSQSPYPKSPSKAKQSQSPDS